jgi:hypothetical protein
LADTELDFGDLSWEEAGGTVRTTLIALHKDVYGNGKPGLKVEVSEVLIYAKSAVLWMKGIASLLTLALLALGTYAAIHH